MQRLAEFEHDVVGDIDREGHRPHPGRDKPSLHPARGGGCRIEADDASQGEELAHLGVLDPARPGRGIRCRSGQVDQALTGIVEGQTECGSDLAGDSTLRKGVAAVGRHGDVERLLA